MNTEQLQVFTDSLAGAIRQAVVEATQQSVAAIRSTFSASPNGRKVPPFCVAEYKSTDEITVQDYFKRFEWALELSKIQSEEFETYAHVHMGTELNKALKILISPKVPESLCYEEIKKILITHFDVKKNKYAESIKFRKVQQEKDETIASYVLRLRQAASSCEYGEFLNRMLIEQMLYGLNSRIICDEIISKKPENFTDAYGIAQAMEFTHHTTVEMKDDLQFPAQQEVHRLGYSPVQLKLNRNHPTGARNNNTNQPSVCFGCGGKHMRSHCKFKQATCFQCGKMGHIAKVCKSSH